MKILHTADIHLKEHGDERWQTLEELVRIGQQEDVGVLVITGDLFDQGVAAENLRPKIREVFSNAGFKVIIIPGNHDSGVYKGGVYFGQDVFVLEDLAKPFECGDLRIWGMPFEPIRAEEVLGRLRLLATHLASDKVNIVLYHGELLDAFFSRKDFGDEGEARYMPVKLSYFNGLSIGYVLAGHFHSRFDAWKLQDGGYFVYPGSPVSITRRETGQRKVNIFEVGNPPREYLLNTPHFEEVNVELDPFVDAIPLQVLRESFERCHPRAKVLLTVTGYVNSEKIKMNEKELVKGIGEIAKRATEVHLEFRDIHEILEDDLFKQFMSKLEGLDYDEATKRRLRDLAINAMMKAGV